MELRISDFEKEFPAVGGQPGFLLSMPPMPFVAGELTFIMGHNGSGKSVFLSLLAGEMAPTNGRVHFRFNGEKWDATSRPVGIVRQRAEDSLAVDLTVRENLIIRSFPASPKEKFFPGRYMAAQIERSLSDHAELHRKLDQPCRELSVGQRQTLAFLAVGSQENPLLLLDEFLAATDQSTSRLLRTLARKYAQRVPACVLVVSHDIDLALQDADRIVILRAGQITHDIRRDSEDWSDSTLAPRLSYADA